MPVFEAAALQARQDARDSHIVQQFETVVAEVRAIFDECGPAIFKALGNVLFSMPTTPEPEPRSPFCVYFWHKKKECIVAWDFRKYTLRYACEGLSKDFDDCTRAELIAWLCKPL